jgi:allophanate hydrolase
MQGLPLNPQLVALGGEFVEATTTTSDYQLFALNSFTPPRPGLLRVTENGSEIALEIWQLPIENYGNLVATVPSPLGFGTLTLADGSTVQGFLCEAYATQHAEDMSHLGGWRAFLASK